ILDLKRRGRTVLFSTHVMQHAERICDRLAILAHGRKCFDGTLAEARRLVAYRVALETADDLSSLRNLPEVAALHDLGGGRWDVELRDAGDPQAILEACFVRQVRLKRFEHQEPTLHD